MKRKLNDDEVRLCERALNDFDEQMPVLKFNLKYQTMMLEEGLEIQHKQNLKQMSLRKVQTENEIENINQHIRILKDQLENGVEVKEEIKDGTTAD